MSWDNYVLSADVRVVRIAPDGTYRVQLTARGTSRPAAVLTVNGVDVQTAFPVPMLVTGINTYLRATPGKLTAEPYGAGWLFEGKSQTNPEAGKGTPDGLLRSEEARKWMEGEVHRLSAFVHEQYSRQEGTMMDGGTFTTGLALQLNRDELLHLFNEFFSPYTGWRTQR